VVWAQVADKPEPDLVVVKGGEPQRKSDFFQKYCASRLIGKDKISNADDDPYTLNKAIFPHKNDFDQRKAVKQLILMAINAKSRTSAFSAFRSDKAKGDPLKKNEKHRTISTT
jgi:hypothetical protein